MQIRSGFHKPHLPPLNRFWVLFLTLVLVAAMLFFSNKSWRTYQVLSNARVIGIEQAADLRAYMDIATLSKDYHISDADMTEVLGSPLPPADMTLHTYAEQQGLDVISLIYGLQSKIPAADAGLLDEPPSLYQQSVEVFIDWMATYGMPVLMLVVFLGALGLPVPAGPLAAFTGVLSFDGSMDALLTPLLILVTTLFADLLLYLVGRKVQPDTLVRYGRWVGYTETNRIRITHLFQNRGGITLLLTRSLVAHVSALASLLAGSAALNYRFFLWYSFLGRSIWLFIYFGLGYLVGGDFSMASSFLSYLSLALLSLLVLFLILELYRKQHVIRPLGL